ncbi:unnamed protein product [Prorocentrum cordatum]|uniref:Uncharacterized protein n=1 Tax=Prorocentrum cordatum TaxID=2364126 RepID=A0ABN9W5X3_9DINO|nr:unnamed protein product [Polarella glacialis]
MAHCGDGVGAGKKSRQEQHLALRNRRGGERAPSHGAEGNSREEVGAGEGSELTSGNQLLRRGCAVAAFGTARAETGEGHQQCRDHRVCEGVQWQKLALC